MGTAVGSSTHPGGVMTEPDEALHGSADDDVEQLPTGALLGEPDPASGAGDDAVNAVDDGPPEGEGR